MIVDNEPLPSCDEVFRRVLFYGVHRKIVYDGDVTKFRMAFFAMDWEQRFQLFFRIIEVIENENMK